MAPYQIGNWSPISLTNTRGRSQGRRTAHLPEDIARLSRMDRRHTGITCRDEGTPYLKNKDARGIPLTVEGEVPGQLGRGRETVHS